MPQSSTIERVVANLHTARFHTCLRASGGDPEAALRLYRWNLDVGSALHSTLALVEVVLRNAIDRELRIWNARQPDGRGGFHRGEWLDDPARPELHAEGGAELGSSQCPEGTSSQIADASSEER